MSGGRLLAVLCLMGVLTLAGPAGADSGQTPIDSGLISFTEEGATAMVLTLPSDSPPPASVAFYVPNGYGVSLTAAPGAEVGALLVASGLLPTIGNLVAEDPTVAAADPTLAACAPGPHAAFWEAGTQVLLGDVVPLRFAVDPTTGTDTALGAYRIQACWPAAQFTSSRLTGLGIVVTTDFIAAPTQTGTYLWHALVSPFAADGVTVDTTQTKDYQGAVPWPSTVSLKQTYLSKSHAEVLTGRVVMAGAPPPAGTIVDVFATSKTVKTLAEQTVPTDAAGAFHARLLLRQSATVEAAPEPYSAPCTTTSPGGCSLVVATLTAGEVKLVVKPKPKKPKKKR